MWMLGAPLSVLLSLSAVAQTYAKCDVAYQAGAVSATSGSPTVTFSGVSFVPSDVGKIAVLAGAGSAPFSVLTAKSIIAAGGSGHSIGETHSLTGGTFTEQAVMVVDAVDGGGAVTAFHMGPAGVYSVVPANPVATDSDITLAIQFVGDPLTGKILSVSGNQATINATAANTVTSMDGYYGTDDHDALQAGLDVTGPALVVLPAGNCLTTAQLEIPRYANMGTFYRPDVKGASFSKVRLFAGARMGAVLNSTGFANQAAVSGLSIEGFYLADYGLYTQQDEQSIFENIFVRNTRVAGYRCGSGVSSAGGNFFHKTVYITTKGIFSSKQQPLYGVWIYSGCTDSEVSTIEAWNTTNSAVYLQAGFSRADAIHGFPNPGPEYGADYVVNVGFQSTVTRTQADGARVAGVYVAAHTVTVRDTICKAAFHLFNSPACVMIANNRNDVVVAGTLLDPASTITSANQVKQVGAAGLRNYICGNPGATYSLC